MLILFIYFITTDHMVPQICYIFLPAVPRTNTSLDVVYVTFILKLIAFHISFDFLVVQGKKNLKCIQG